MTERTLETTVTFKRPFHLPSAGVPLSAGTYRLVTEDEEVPGLSFLAYRRAKTVLQIPAVSTPGSRSQTIAIDAAELEAALEADGKAEPVSS